MEYLRLTMEMKELDAKRKVVHQQRSKVVKHLLDNFHGCGKYEYEWEPTCDQEEVKCGSKSRIEMRIRKCKKPFTLDSLTHLLCSYLKEQWLGVENAPSEADMKQVSTGQARYILNHQQVKCSEYLIRVDYNQLKEMRSKRMPRESKTKDETMDSESTPICIVRKVMPPKLKPVSALAGPEIGPDTADTGMGPIDKEDDDDDDDDHSEDNDEEEEEYDYGEWNY